MLATNQENLQIHKKEFSIDWLESEKEKKERELKIIINISSFLLLF